MLSWSSGQIPVAVVRGSKGGKNDGKILYLSDKQNAPPGSFVDLEMLDGQLQVYPNPSQRNVAYCAGQSGSGKSTWMGNYIAEYALLHKDRPIFIVSRLNDDKAFDDIPNVERIPAESVLTDNLTMTNFPEGCFVLFDDTETIPDDKVKKAVQKLRTDILETGRHRMIDVGITNHNLIDGNSTRTILNEAHYLTVFPKGGSMNQLRYLLKTYLGFSREEIAFLTKLPSRWVSIYRNYPGCVVYSTGAYTAEGGANKPKSALLR